MSPHPWDHLPRPSLARGRSGSLAPGLEGAGAGHCCPGKLAAVPAWQSAGAASVPGGSLGDPSSCSVCFQPFPESVYVHRALGLCYSIFFPLSGILR